MTQTKVCTKCGEEKALDRFHKERKGSLGVTSQCKSCRKKFYQENRDKFLEYKKQHRKGNRDKILEGHKQYYQENRDKILEYQNHYYQENKGKSRANRVTERARKLKATPDWLTPIDYLIIRDIYESRPEGCHVDHIVPLRGKTVCGLHVPWNLQHLPAEENISKGNRVWPDMWEET